MIQLFNTVLYQPIFNLLVWLYNVIPGHDIGIAIILLTIVIKAILYPFSLQSIKAQKSMKDLQPKIEELKKKFKGQKDVLAREMMQLYKKEKINPMSSCLPLLIQFPFLIAVFRVFRTGLGEGSLDMLYSFVHNPGALNPISFGFLDLSKPQVALAILAGAAQYWQAKMMVTKQPPKQVENKEGAKDEGMAAAMNKQMLYLMPVITVIIGLTLPGGLALYWLVTTLLMVAQQKYFFKKDGGREVVPVQANQENK
ncbi:YidC/Oxa1 family membrane protein insertase [Patescibacteria group bacterium]|nr:YidC/Oxa1 family membrane protein insertase [Patescibacteria group bacterium]MBU4511725.1 YidC/Oxa1 family membrane protein insertase [Patescibacteria group bacterium]MCG2692836.1 YidC/Oxa1 family membrane protein insertase [Candidatus Parcubacteria bacterium]